MGGFMSYPLQRAIQYNNLDKAELLLQYNADPYLEDTQGKNSYETARFKPDFIELMDSYNPDIKEPAEYY